MCWRYGVINSQTQEETIDGSYQELQELQRDIFSRNPTQNGH